MRHLLNSTSSSDALRQSFSVVFLLAAFAGSLSGASAAQLTSTCSCHSANPFAAGADSSETRLTGTLHGYAGQRVAIALWKARRPKTADQIQEIRSPEVTSIVKFLRHSRAFQDILARLESDRTARYSRTRNGEFVRHRRDRYVRETGIVVWIPKEPGELGVHQQAGGAIFVHSNFERYSPNATLSTPCDVTLTNEARYHIRIHTHPWGTVPSAADQQRAVFGLVDLVVAEKDGVPTIYMYTAKGEVWELPTASLLPAEKAPQDTDVFVAQR